MYTYPKCMPYASSRPQTLHFLQKKIIPIAFMFSLSIVCSNSAYAYLSIGYLQMLKSTHPVITYFLCVICGRLEKSPVLLSITAFISMCVVITTTGELAFTWFGFLLQLASTLSDAIRCVLIDMMSKEETPVDPISMLYYVSPFTTFFISIGFTFFELNRFPLDHSSANLFVSIITSAVIAFMLNISVFLLISRTSALMMSVSAPVKDICLIITSYYFFKNSVTGMQVFGYLLSLFGVYAYSRYNKTPDTFWLDLEYVRKEYLIRASEPTICNDDVHVSREDSPFQNEERKKSYDHA